MNLKRLFLYLTIANVALLASCSSEELDGLIGSKEFFTIVVKCAPAKAILDDSSVITRAGISGSTSSWSMYFDNGVDTVDTMGLFPYKGYQIPFELPIPKGTTANNVVIKAEGWATKKATTYGVYIPFKFNNRDYSKIPWDLRSVPFQKSNTDFIPACHKMLYASDTVQAKGDTLDAMLYMKGAILQIRSKFTTGNQKFVKMMLASSDANQFTVYGTLNMFKNSPDAYNTSVYGVNQELTEIVHSDHLTILLDNIEKNSSNYVVGYFTVPPCDFTGKTLTVYLWDSDGNVYAGSSYKSASTPIYRHSFRNFNFTTMTLYTGITPSLNPWEKTENICPTCTPVAF